MKNGHNQSRGNQTPIDILDLEVYPRLYECIDSAFPEFGFKRFKGHWRASKEATRSLSGSPRPNRVYVYEDRPFGMVIQGGEFVPWTSYLAGGSPPQGPAFFEVARELAERAGADSSLFETTLTDDEQQQLTKWRRKQGLFEAAASIMKTALLQTPEAIKARSYLTQERGFSEQDIQKETSPFGFYTTKEDLQKRLLTLGFTKKEVEESGLVSDGRWKGRLVGAWRNRQGHIATFFARSLGKATKLKYLYLKGGAKPEVFGANIAVRNTGDQGQLVITEGVFDVALFQSQGFGGIVSTGGGGSQLTQKKWEELASYGVSSFVLAFDNDDTGLEGTITAIDNAYKLPSPPELFVLPPELYPEGTKDPDEFLRKYGMDQWLDALEKKLHALRYKAHKLLEKHSEGLNEWTDTQLSKLINEAVEFAAPLPSKRVGVELEQFFWPLIIERTKLQQSLIQDRLQTRREQLKNKPKRLDARNQKADKKRDEATSIQRLTFEDLDTQLAPIEWVWPGWLPAGLLTILASEPGIGKSALCLFLSKCFIQGESWPDGSDYTGALGSILWCEAEAAQAINLSRAKAWKLPLQSIELPRFKDALTEVQLDKKEHREAVKAAAYSEDVKLIVVDSLRGAHSKDENTSETIQIVMWLAQLARDTNKPILLTHHLRKRSNNDSNTTISLDRLRGSSAILQPARVIWAMNAPNQDDPEVKQLSVIKSNLGAFPEPIGFMIDEEGIEFCDPPMSPQKETSLGRAEEKILQLLVLNGGALQTEELYVHLDSLGISKRTAKRAKKSLNISAQRKDGKWYWLLPN